MTDRPTMKVPPPPSYPDPAPAVPTCPIPPAPGAAMTALRGPAVIPELPAPTLMPEGRDAKGRFAHGNPGRQPGYRHRATLAMEALFEGQAEALTTKAIDMALRGDGTAMRLCLERLMPARKGVAVTIPNFPQIETAADVPKAFAAIIAASTAGHCSADDAAPLVALLTAFSGALDTALLAAQLDELQRQVEELRNGPR